MLATSQDCKPSFSERMLRLRERSEHRCARTPSEKEAAYRVRYDAYIRQQLIAPRDDRMLRDECFDDTPNAWITTTFIDRALASTFRIHVAERPGDPLPSARVYADVIAPRLESGCVLVDPTRLAARLTFAGSLSELPFLALRPAWLAAEHFDADFVLATVTADHQPFYRRVFGYEAWSEPRDYPGFKHKVACLGLDFRAARARVETRFPVFRSTAAEREALFGRRRVACGEAAPSAA